MKSEPDKNARLAPDAIRIISLIGRACGLRYKEIDDIIWRIKNKTETLMSGAGSPEKAKDPFLLVLFALNDQCNEKILWYKPWIGWRYDQIRRHYCNWWEQFDPSVGIATIAKDIPCPA